MFHVRGQLKPADRGRSMHFFPQESSGIVMVHEPDNSCLFYSQSKTPDLGAYFEQDAVILRKHGNPALFIGPDALESDRGDGLYLIGDQRIVFALPCKLVRLSSFRPDYQRETHQRHKGSRHDPGPGNRIVFSWKPLILT